MMKCVIIYNRKYYLYQIRCLLKTLRNTIDFQNLTVKPILNVQHISNPNRFIKSQLCFSYIHEMTITFIISIGYTTYDYYIRE